MSNQVVIRSASGQWLRFQDPSEVIQTQDSTAVLASLRRVEALVTQKRHYAAGFVSYDAAPAFDWALPVRESKAFPLVWFGIFEQPQVVRLERPAAPTCHDRTEWLPSMSMAEYEAAVAGLRELIAQGATYQVNYTFRLRRPWAGDPWQFFLRLVEAQEPPHAAFVDTPRLAVCSASPELFFRLSGETIVSQPMKGTAPRGRSYTEDVARAEWLVRSEKNRAENAMIVDMMRNDLGKIARTGSVRVRDLFRVDRYPTLWQMTSTVGAETAAPVTEVLAALFPCASVTGAPKPNTMRIISRTETEPRGIYTGAIGMIGPDRQAQFNVAIRTVVIDKASAQAEYGVGGGVVWDSTPAGEYQECLLKAQILEGPGPEFSLLETMLWEGEACQGGPPMEGYFLLDGHLRRLEESAVYFGFALDLDRVRLELGRLAAALPPVAHRVRLLASRDGELSCRAEPKPGLVSTEPVRLALASRPVDSADPFLCHKTTHRAVYEEACSAGTQGDEVLFRNERGEITETSIANVVLRFGDDLLTPPVDCGLLPGVFRAWLLTEGRIRERVLPLESLGRCDEVLLINSVRKWRQAVLLDEA